MVAVAGWTYRRLYTGTVHNGLDRLAVSLLPGLLELPGLADWFFVRFADPGGVHLRLRVRLPEPAIPDFDRLCEEKLQVLPRLPPFLYRPALRIDIGERVVDQQSVLRIARDTYLPETDKFGSTGMVRAEALFQVSSEIAVEVLTQEDRGLYSRKTAAHAFMDAARESFVPEIAPSDFWTRYARHWFQRSGEDGNKLWAGLQGKAARLASAGLLADPLHVPEDARPLLGTWRRALGSCAQGYREDEGNTIPLPVLAGNFAHLMNNRLGLLPIEDAYYAVILQRAMEPQSLAADA